MNYQRFALLHAGRARCLLISEQFHTLLFVSYLCCVAPWYCSETHDMFLVRTYFRILTLQRSVQISGHSHLEVQRQKRWNRPPKLKLRRKTWRKTGPARNRLRSPKKKIYHLSQFNQGVKGKWRWPTSMSYPSCKWCLLLTITYFNQTTLHLMKTHTMLSTMPRKHRSAKREASCRLVSLERRGLATTVASKRDLQCISKFNTRENNATLLQVG